MKCALVTEVPKDHAYCNITVITIKQSESCADTFCDLQWTT